MSATLMEPNPRARRDRGRVVWAWLAAARPQTLWAGAVPVVVGSAFAWRDAVFDAGPALAALLGSLLIQIGTNLTNDYYDWRRGADAADRVGPVRASASGAIEPRHVLQGAFVAFGLAAAAGLYLLSHSAWPILLVGVSAILSGYLYTGGPYPLGYHGWGDLFVFVFFGPVAVAGTYFVQAGPAPYYVLAAALPIGALSTAILVVNNLRDIDTDRRAGKRTLAVRLGATGARAEYAFLLGAAYVAAAGLAVALEAPLLFLPWATLPWAAQLGHRLWTTGRPRDLNPLLPRTARLLGAFGLLLSIGAVVVP